MAGLGFELPFDPLFFSQITESHYPMAEKFGPRWFNLVGLLIYWRVLRRRTAQGSTNDLG
jgi:hypothetical protein